MSLSDVLLRPFATIHIAVKVIILFIGGVLLFTTPIGAFLWTIQNGGRIMMWFDSPDIFKLPKTDEDIMMETMKKMTNEVN